MFDGGAGPSRATTLVGYPQTIPTPQPWVGYPYRRPATVLQGTTRTDYDELGRAVRVHERLFLRPSLPATFPVALTDGDGDGWVTTQQRYDASSRLIQTIDDDGRETDYRYDGANRLIETEDAVGNRVELDLDRAGNVRVQRSVEQGVVSARTITTTFVHDQLGRVKFTVDGLNQTTQTIWGARDLALEQIDADGVHRRWTHDELRRLREERILGPAGATPPLDGGNPAIVDGAIAVTYGYDLDSNLTSITDDAGRSTTFVYDDLSRRTDTVLASGATTHVTYDADGNVKTVKDPNGSVRTHTVDGLNRVVRIDVARAPGVGGTTVQTFAYDGGGALFRATDDNGGLPHACEWTWDSLGRKVEERQDLRPVATTYTGSGLRTKLVHPSGRTVTFTHDGLGRVHERRLDGSLISSSEWAGPGLREMLRSHGNGTALTFLADFTLEETGYDAILQPVRLRVLGPSTAAIVDREYGHGRTGELTFERRLDDGGLTDRYTYDAADRVTATTYGGGATQARTYAYDGVGNRGASTETPRTGSPSTTSYTSNLLNQYTEISTSTGPTLVRTHDDNGNLTSDGVRTFQYDAFDRLLSVKDGSVDVARYEYLPDGRRVHKEVLAPGGAPTEVTTYVSDGPREIEELDGLRGGAVSTVYLWSDAYVDELIAFERTAAHSRGPGRFYVHQNARHDVVAISDAAGALVEKRTFDDFGRMTVTYGSSVGLDLGFQGRRHDRETGLVYFRARYYDPQTGRFLSRDAVWDPGNVGNPYTFCANNPTSLIDPSGNWIEDSVFAVPSIALGAKSLGRNLGEGKFVSALIDVVGLVLDTAALLTPGVPGGAGQTIGGLRTAIRAGNAAMQAVGLGLAVAGELGMMEGEGEDDGGEAGGEDEPDMLGNCFLAGTLVSMADGTKRPIEEVRPGDRVKASDPRDGQVVDREVVRTFRNVTDTVVDVTWAPLDRVECMAVGSRGRGERHSVGVARAGGESSEDGEPPSADEAQTVRCTPGHPWWVEGQQRWVLAGDLRVGDQLRLEDGRLAAVQAVASRRQAARTFNFEVEGLHTYFVAGNQHAAGVCVHNASRLSFLADAGVFASRIGSPGIRRALRRGLDRVIAAGSRFHIHVIEEIETELTNAGRLRTWMTQLKRYMMAGATVIPSADTTKLTSLIAGKFGPNDLKLVQTAIERGLPIVTANPRLVNQVMNKPEFRGVGLRILVAGEHFTGARSLSAALADATVGLIR